MTFSIHKTRFRLIFSIYNYISDDFDWVVLNICENRSARPYEILATSSSRRSRWQIVSWRNWARWTTSLRFENFMTFSQKTWKSSRKSCSKRENRDIFSICDENNLNFIFQRWTTRKSSLRFSVLVTPSPWMISPVAFCTWCPVGEIKYKIKKFENPKSKSSKSIRLL